MGPEAVSGFVPDFEPFNGRIAPFAPLVFSMMLGTAMTTASSISLEGKGRWIIASMPQPPRISLGAKVLLNMLIVAPLLAIGATVLAIAYWESVLISINTFVLPMATVSLMAVVNLRINKRFPDYDWTNEVQPVKQSLAVMLSLGISFLIGLIIIFVGILARLLLPEIADLLTLALALVIALIALLMFNRVCSKKLYFY